MSDKIKRQALHESVYASPEEAVSGEGDGLMTAELVATALEGVSGVSGPTFIERTEPNSPDLFTEMTAINAFTAEFEVDVPTHMTISGHIDYTRRQLSALGDNATFVAHIIRLNGSNIDASKTGDNIPNHAKHYCVLPLHAYALLAPGAHVVQVFARSDSTAAPGVNGQAEVKGTYNHMLIRLEPAS